MITINRDTAERCCMLTCSVVLPCSRAHVVAFFSDAFQLEQITPDWLHFRVLTPAPIELQKGSLIDYRIRLHGIPVGWQTEISSWDPPCSFTDRQVLGPYRLWEHLHTFEVVEGGTAVIDTVRDRPIGGRLTNLLVVEKDLRGIFEYRRQRMLELFPETTSAAAGADS